MDAPSFAIVRKNREKNMKLSVTEALKLPSNSYPLRVSGTMEKGGIIEAIYDDPSGLELFAKFIERSTHTVAWLDIVSVPRTWRPRFV